MSGADTQDTVPWPTVLVIIGAGVLSAVQVGEAPMALGAIQADLGIGLTTASWLVSAIAVVGAWAGSVIGVAGDQIGACRMALGGLLPQAAAGAASALAQGPALPLSLRVGQDVRHVFAARAPGSWRGCSAPPRTRPPIGARRRDGRSDDAEQQPRPRRRAGDRGRACRVRRVVHGRRARDGGGARGGVIRNDVPLSAAPARSAARLG